MMKSITAKQRRNAEREFTSTTCAGCDGPKERGVSFCGTCTKLLVEQGWKNPGKYFTLLTVNLKQGAEAYTERLTWLLSSAGQRLRLRGMDV